MIGVAPVNSGVCGINIYEAAGIKTAPSVRLCAAGTDTDQPEYQQRCPAMRLNKNSRTAGAFRPRVGSPVKMSVEVERKFICSDDTLKTLEDMAVCVGQKQFQDQYFDTPEFALTLKDTWLRKRKGCWELKCPTSTVGRREGLCTHYQEISTLPEIFQKVKEVLKHPLSEEGNDGPGPSEEEDSWLKVLNLECFAEFTTMRRSFTLEGVQIDLDQADFGYHVGEIEVLIPEGGDVQLAQERIRNTAQKLNLSEEKRVEGKMSVYLKRYRPEHYAKLLSAHIL